MNFAPRRLAFLLGAGLVAATLSVGGPASAEAEVAPTGLSAGTVSPKFMLPVVNRDKYTESRRFGPAKWVGPKAGKNAKKLVVMSFFATYCEPCKKEMPELVRLYETYKDQGLGVMLVSIDKGSDMKKVVVDLAAEHNVTFPVMHDRFQVVARRYKAERLPYMLMLSPDGTIKTVHVGYTEDMKAGLENEVRGHLGLEPLAAPAAVEKSGAAAEGNTDGEVSSKSKKKGKKAKKSKRKMSKKKSKKKKAS